MWFDVPRPIGRHEQACEAVRALLHDTLLYAAGDVEEEKVLESLERWKFLAGIPE
jgi:hypothetical protein